MVLRDGYSREPYAVHLLHLSSSDVDRGASFARLLISSLYELALLFVIRPMMSRGAVMGEQCVQCEWEGAEHTVLAGALV